MTEADDDMVGTEGKQMGQLEGKVTIVTGAGRGIGRAIALLFAREGAKVAVVSRTPSSVDSVVEEIAQKRGTAVGLHCDVSRRDQVRQAVAQTVDQFGGVDVLVNNAHDTTSITASVLETTQEMFLQQFGSALFSTMHFMQACFPYLKERQGRVINFASGAGILGAPNYVAYAATKEAIRAVSRVAAREWGVHRINVNVICPTSMTDALKESIKDAQVLEAVSRAPLGIPGDPLDQIAPVALFLATDASQYITGHTMMVEGGALIDAGR
jgi:NAD(P)-dependent dehydrogenase (short-subunit alcohol dehydrogenase family)